MLILSYNCLLATLQWALQWCLGGRTWKEVWHVSMYKGSYTLGKLGDEEWLLEEWPSSLFFQDTVFWQLTQ